MESIPSLTPPFHYKFINPNSGAQENVVGFHSNPPIQAYPSVKLLLHPERVEAAFDAMLSQLDLYAHILKYM